VYTIKDNGRTLEFLHKVSRNRKRKSAALALTAQTKTDDIPAAVAGFQGFLLVGVGKSLRLYEMGKKALLRKCESNVSGTAGAEAKLTSGLPNMRRYHQRHRRADHRR
jgi:splicing factor 3B subunit 3